MEIKLTDNFLSYFLEKTTESFFIDILLVTDIKIDDAIIKSISLLKENSIKVIRDNEKEIFDNMKKYEKYFELNRAEFPLIKQHEIVRRNGFGKINPFIDLLLISELTTGVLAGVQDLKKIEGSLQIDLANENETFTGMRSIITCKRNDIILKDDKTIIASLLKGPDLKTKLSNHSTNIIFFAFGITGISHEATNKAVKVFETAFSNVAEMKRITLTT